MGTIKRILEENEGQHDAAINIAIRARVLRICKDHDESILKGEVNIKKAYELGKSEFDSNLFTSHAVMNAAIKDAVEENCSDVCVACENRQYS